MDTMKKLKNKRQLLLMTGAAVVLVIIAALLLTSRLQQSGNGVNTTTAPTFATLLPKASSIESLGGWQKGTSPNGDTYYSFKDTVDGVTVRVTEQLLPASFANDLQKKTAEIAEGYNATRTLPIDTPVSYIGVSAKGQQSVIFTKKKLLVLIASETTIPDDAWVKYIESLE